MSEIKIIYDFQKFKKEIESLYQQIEKEKIRCRSNYEHVGRSVPDRISFEELDLNHLKNRLLSVHKTLECRRYTLLSPQRARMARFIAVGGICELIKDAYVGKFWDLYLREIGESNRNFVRNEIWEKGFQESGIELISRGMRREFVQTLVMESGVPKERTGDIISFFKIYWRYLKPADVMKIISDLKENSYLSFRKIPRMERDKLKKLSENASEYTKAFVRAVDRLTTVFDYIFDSEKIHGGNVREFENEVFRGTGIHPFSFLRNHEQLEHLYKNLLGYVTPYKLRKIIESKPPNTTITTPDGKKVKAYRYQNIIFGKHLLDNASFFCVPHKDFDGMKLKSIQYNSIEKSGNSILLKSKSDIIPVVNAALRNDLVHAFYFNGKKCGNVFYFSDITGCGIHVKTSDKKVNDFIYGDDGFTGSSFLIAEKEKDGNSLYLKVNLRLFCRELREKSISFKTPECNFPIYEGRCDKSGMAICSERSLPIEYPEPGNIEILAFEPNDAGEDSPVILSDGARAEIFEFMDDIMLFHAGSGRRILPKKSGQGYSVGGDRFILYCSEALLKKRAGRENLRIEKPTKHGQYLVSLVCWEDPSLPCSLSIEKEAGEYVSWRFEKCINFNAWVEKKRSINTKHIKFNKYQGQDASDFELKIAPFPSVEEQKKLFWSISLNDSNPYTIEVGHCCQGEDRNKSGFHENYLHELLKPVWRGKNAGNAKVEISLCTLDFVFSSIRFYLLPDLDIKFPESVPLNGDFKARVFWGKCRAWQDVFLKNRRGRSRVTAGFQLSNNSWQIFKKRHIVDFKIPDVDTTVKIEADQPIRAVLLGNRDRLEKERLRDLKVAELDNYDLMVVEPGHNPPSVSVNGVSHNDFFKKNDFGVWSVPLAGLSGLNQFRNSVLINAEDISCTFNVLCPMIIWNFKVDESLSRNTLNGKCFFAGPTGSEIAIRVYPEKNKKENILSEKKIYGSGMQDVNFCFSLDLPVSEEYLPNQLYVYVFYSNEKGELVEYEESFSVSSERHLCKTKFHKIKQRIDQDLKEHRAYSAKRLLKIAAPYVPGFQKKWFKAQWDRAWGGTVKNTLDSAVCQVTEILKDNYLIDLTADKYNGKN